MKYQPLFIGLLLLVGVAQASPTYYLSEYNSNLKLLMHYNGTYAHDEGMPGYTIANTGTTFNTTTQLIGNASMYSTGNAQYITWTSANTSTDVWPANGTDYTLMFYFNVSAVSAAGSSILGPGTRTSDSHNTLGWGISSYQKHINFQADGATNPWANVYGGTQTVYPNIKNQAVIQIYSNNTIMQYLNGTLDKVSNGTLNQQMNNNINSVTFPNTDGGTFTAATGSFDELAIWKGVVVPISLLYPLPYEIGVQNGSTPTAPIVSFTSNVTSGVPLTSVQFNDTSVVTPTAWNWSFQNITPGNNTVVYWSTIQNATITLGAGNWNFGLNVTNASGYNKTTAAYFVNVSTSGGLSGWNRQDILMNGAYLQTFHITDASTGIGIPVVTLLDNNGNIYTTTNGTGYLTETYGAGTVTFTATGYGGKIITYVFDSAASHDVQLTPNPVTPSPYAVTYPPKDVRFHLQTIWGKALPGAHVEANVSQTTLGNYSYVASLYGYSLTNVPLDTLKLQGYTDSRGDITFAMMADVQYAMNYTLAGYTFPVGTTITPHDDNYIIYADSTGSTIISNGTSPQASVTYSVLTNRTSMTVASVYINFTDVAGATTNGFVVLSQTNTTLGNNTPPVILANETFTGNLTAKNYTLWDGVTASCPASNSTVYNGTGYKVGCINATLVNDASCSAKTVGFTPTGTVQAQESVWFKNIASPIAGLSPEFALFMALGIMMFTAMMAGVSSAPAISLCVTFEGWVFYGMNCFNIIDYTLANSGASAIVGVLVVMSFISFLYLFVTYRRTGK